MINNRQALPLLPDSDWFIPSKVAIPTQAACWLQDKGSTTAKFKQQSRRFRLECCFEGWVSPASLGSEAGCFSQDPSLWLREVLLYCDGQPWLYGRTVIPQGTFEDAELALTTLGTMPLGERLFNQATRVKRDCIELAAITPPSTLRALLVPPLLQFPQRWWARRSRLTVRQSSLWLTEVFFPASPLY